MAFDKAAFNKARLAPRTETVKVAGMDAWFGDGPAEFTVRGLTAAEVGRANEAVSRNKQLDIYSKAMASTEEQVAEIRRVLGMGDNTPDDIAKRLDQLIVGCVDPVLDNQTAVKLSEAFPCNFYLLTNKIQTLTAMGMDLVKPAPSGNNRKSEH